MRNNVLDNISIPKSGFKRSRFNFSHDVNTTFGWGEVQPTLCKKLVAGSKTIRKGKALVRFAPLVSPTFGRVHYKSFDNFVPISDIFPNYDSMMSQQPKSTAGATQVAQFEPYIKLGQLSSWCLQGARATLYFAIDTNDGKTAAENASEGNYITWYRPDNASETTQSDWQQYFDRINAGGVFQVALDAWNNAGNGVLPLENSVCLRLGRVSSALESVFNSSYAPVALCNKVLTDLCPVSREYEPDYYDGETPLNSWQKEVTIEGADLLIEGNVQYGSSSSGPLMQPFLIALEFSDFGKRLRKILQGLGYQLNLQSAKNVSILPLLAYYKAYFDTLGLQEYQGWETTYCARIIKYIENSFSTDVSGMFLRTNKTNLGSIGSSNYGVAFFIQELANTWYTERADFVGANIVHLNVSPNPQLSPFVSVDDVGEFKLGANISRNSVSLSDLTNNTQSPDGVANSTGSLFINQLQHGQVDATLLQRLYRWTNKYSLLGRSMRKIIDLFGLGKYVDGIECNYIGHCDKLLTISDVVSMAATQDAMLGEFGGKGLEYFENKKLVFENDVVGYWITMACIVPESGYTQGLDPTLTYLKKSEQYQADFDAVGFEATPKDSVCSTQYLVGSQFSDAVGNVFGFVPRLTGWKIHKNLVNGDFNRHNLRNVYLPYTLDKQLYVDDFEPKTQYVYDGSGSLKIGVVRFDKSARLSALPVAGDWARTPTKYSWLGNFDRIFAKQPEEGNDVIPSSDMSRYIAVGWSSFTRDNFMMHQINEFICHAPMKPTEDSFGVDNGDENSPVTGSQSVSKA